MKFSYRIMAALTRHRSYLPLLGILATAILASCSDSGVNFAGGGIGGTGKSRGTITAKGSIFVNGVEFETFGAAITLDDNPATEEDLKVGMVATVKGTFNSDGLTGEGDEIEVENEVQGSISGFGPEPESFTVLGLKIFVDGTTVYSNVLDISGLSVDDVVEVHGQRDSLTNLRATRVELLQGARLTEDDELKGTVSGLSGTTFFIGSQFVESSGALVKPSGTADRSDIQDRVLVEVHGVIAGTHPTFGPIFLANTVDIEDLEDAAFDLIEGEKFEVEGFIADFFGHPGIFLVNNNPVQTTASTRFEGGVAADLANDIKVEAEGDVISGGVLLVEKIEFKDAIRIESNPTSITSTSVTILGKTVLVTSQTDTSKFTTDINEGLKVRGFLNSDGTTITATRLEDTDPVDFDKQILQGPVEDFDRSARSLVITGITVDASGVEENNFEGDDDQPLGSTRFFDILENAAGIVVVKARGVFDGAVTITADKVEIE